MALTRGKTCYVPHGPKELAEAEARDACSRLLIVLLELSCFFFHKHQHQKYIEDRRAHCSCEEALGPAGCSSRPLAESSSDASRAKRCCALHGRSA